MQCDAENADGLMPVKDYVVGITVGDDGFIVGANPLSSKELSKPYIDIFTNMWYNIKS